MSPRRASTAVGVDVVRVSHIAESVERFGARFLNKVYTTQELSYCLEDVPVAAPRLAARFAAKEAVMKVLRAGDRALSWKSIEVVRAPEGWCELALYDEAEAIAAEGGLLRFAVCLSHEGDYATAVVLAERGRRRNAHAG